ncbi:hypothetical protein BH11MYX4_BH11MYX4_54860 [soil metagenome]
MLSRFLLVPSIALVVLATAGAAHAQDAQTQAQGRALFNDGAALFARGDYAAACPKFAASIKAYSGISTRGTLAECYEKLGRYASAWAAYREVAQLAMRSGDPTREQVASARAKALEPKLSYVTLTLPPGNDSPGLIVKRGGVEIERAKLGSAEPVDSGAITVEISAPGRKTFSTQLTAVQGQSVKLEIPALAPSGEGTAPPPPPPTTFTEPPTAVHGDPPAWQKPVGLVLVGVGVVGMGVGTVFGLSAKSKYDGAFADGGGCDRATKQCDAPGQSAIDDARSKATLSTILFIAGGALTVAGAVVFITAPSSRARALQVAPTGYAGGGGLSLSGTL